MYIYIYICIYVYIYIYIYIYIYMFVRKEMASVIASIIQTDRLNQAKKFSVES